VYWTKRKRSQVIYLTENRSQWNVGGESIPLGAYIHGDSLSGELEIVAGTEHRYVEEDRALVTFQRIGNAVYLVSDKPIEGLKGVKHECSSKGISRAETKKILDIAYNNPDTIATQFEPIEVYKISDEDGSAVYFRTPGDSIRFRVDYLIRGQAKCDERYLNVMAVAGFSYKQRANPSSEFVKKTIYVCGKIKPVFK